MQQELATFLSFGVFGFVPLLAYVLSLFAAALRPHTLVTACVLTGLTLFTLGSIKVKVTGRNWLVSGLEMLLIGGIAALAAYGIGRGLSGLA